MRTTEHELECGCVEDQAQPTPTPLVLRMAFSTAALREVDLAAPVLVVATGVPSCLDRNS